MLLSFIIGLNSPNLSAALCIKFAPAHAMLVKFKVLLANQLNLQFRKFIKNKLQF